MFMYQVRTTTTTTKLTQVCESHVEVSREAEDANALPSEPPVVLINSEVSARPVDVEGTLRFLSTPTQL